MEKILVLSGMPGAGASSLIEGLQKHFQERLNVIETYTTRLRPNPGPEEVHIPPERFEHLSLLWRVEHDDRSCSGVSRAALDQALSGRRGRLSVMVAPPLAFSTINDYVREHVARSGDTDDGWIPCLITAPNDVIRRRLTQRALHPTTYGVERTLLLHAACHELAQREAKRCGRQLRLVSNGSATILPALTKLLSLVDIQTA